MTKTMEERVKELEKLSAKYSLEIERLQAAQEIRNILALYEIIHTANTIDLTAEACFALKQEDVRAEIADWGVWEGPKQVKILYEILHGKGAMTDVGTMFEHHITTECIQVAGDCKTAKGTFFSPGHETHFNAARGDYNMWWCWGKYAGDFIKEEDGKWKIWHWHWYTNMLCDYHTGWIGSQQNTYMRFPEYPPSQDTTFHEPYGTSKIMMPNPPWPAPYETWEDTLKPEYKKKWDDILNCLKERTPLAMSPKYYPRIQNKP